MKFKINSEDPLNILQSTKYVCDRSKHVQIDLSLINKVAEKVGKKLKQGTIECEYGLGIEGNFEKDIQLLLIEDAINFCFWSEKSKDKWSVEYPPGNKVSGGWFSLVSCFKRATDRKIPITDSNYLLSLDKEELKGILEGVNNIEIPLLNERLNNLHETGEILINKYGGKFISVLEEAEFDAINLVNILAKNFSSFRDISLYQDKKIFFFKRAQILSNDISYLSKLDKRAKLGRLNLLSAFADYKIPQILRNEKMIEYSENLAKRIDNYDLIPHNSEEEIEIRAATIWSVELIRQKLERYTAAQIDNAIWLISQDQTKVEKPYHRTYTIFY
jgi:hypothetical protein